MSVNGIEDVWCRQPETTFDGALLDNVYAYRDRWTLLNFARFNNLSVLIERARVLRLADWLSVIGTDERASLSLSLWWSIRCARLITTNLVIHIILICQLLTRRQWFWCVDLEQSK